MQGRRIKETVPLITQERVKFLFDYNPDTGELVWKNPYFYAHKVGDIVGYKQREYKAVKVDGYTVYVHVLVWIWHYDYVPVEPIFHIDGSPWDNRIENLKVYDRTEVLTQERVRELFEYNPETGEFKRKEKLYKGMNQHLTGKEGCNLTTNVIKNRYYRVCIDGKRYLIHRVIWLWMEGYFPEHPIDHISRDSSDNRWCNLRVVTPQCNMRNTGNYAHNTSGVKGVYYDSKKDKWCARVKLNGKTRHLYKTDDFTEAVAHRLAAESCLGWAGCDSSSPAYQYMQKYLKGAL